MAGRMRALRGAAVGLALIAAHVTAAKTPPAGGESERVASLLKRTPNAQGGIIVRSEEVCSESGLDPGLFDCDVSTLYVSCEFAIDELERQIRFDNCLSRCREFAESAYATLRNYVGAGLSTAIAACCSAGNLLTIAGCIAAAIAVFSVFFNAECSRIRSDLERCQDQCTEEWCESPNNNR
uniref:Uncharacterized protein n=1 Tax=uncultured Acidobacteriota bacterium TaxID=171953 RepID=H5SFX3_9BACT|nr:hypothetical protein HGMM_F22D11C36 [uncultured Acidobacteriota bacterium]